MRRGECLRHAGSASSFCARRARRRGLLRQRRVERRRQRRDARAIMLDHAGQPLRQIGVAQEPDQRGRAAGPARRRRARAAPCRHLAVERVDLVVERRHVVAVAHRGEGGGDGGRRRAGLVGDPHHQRRPAAVDHRIGELRRDDLAPQPVLLQRVGKFLRDQPSGNSGRARGRDRDRPARWNRAGRRRARAWRRRAAPTAPAASAAAGGGRARRSPCRRAGYSTARSSSPRCSSVCISRCWKPKSSRPRRSPSDSASVCR